MRTHNHDPHRYPQGTKPDSNGRTPTKPYIVTVTTDNFVEVNARDEDHARTLVTKRLAADFGGRMRQPRISDIEEVT